MTGPAHQEAVGYLLRYASDDWVMLSVVVSEARDVAGPSASKSDVVGVVMDLASSLLDEHVVPGDLGDDFTPWKGSREQRLARLRAELEAMAVRDALPAGADICWFHKVDTT